MLKKTLVKEVIHCRIYRNMRLSKGPWIQYLHHIHWSLFLWLRKKVL